MSFTAGGKTAVDVNEKDVQEAALFSVQAISQQTNEALQLVEVIKAYTQVVSGVKYILDLKLNNKVVRVEVWDQPWAKHRELVNWQVVDQ